MEVDCPVAHGPTAKEPNPLLDRGFEAVPDIPDFPLGIVRTLREVSHRLLNRRSVRSSESGRSFPSLSFPFLPFPYLTVTLSIALSVTLSVTLSNMLSNMFSNMFHAERNVPINS